MRAHVVLGSLAMMALFTGCESAARPTGPDPRLLAAQQGGPGAFEAVEGSGVFDLSAAAVGNATFGYSIRQLPNGAASGQFHQVREANGYVIDFRGRATCVSVDAVNHRAWIAGVILKNNSTHPSFQADSLFGHGKAIWFRVVDYGSGSPADRSTVFGFKGSAGILTSPEYCATRPWPAGDARTWPVLSGGLTVNPGS